MIFTFIWCPHTWKHTHTLWATTKILFLANTQSQSFWKGRTKYGTFILCVWVKEARGNKNSIKKKKKQWENWRNSGIQTIPSKCVIFGQPINCYRRQNIFRFIQFSCTNIPIKKTMICRAKNVDNSLKCQYGILFFIHRCIRAPFLIRCHTQNDLPKYCTGSLLKLYQEWIMMINGVNFISKWMKRKFIQINKFVNGLL